MSEPLLGNHTTIHNDRIFAVRTHPSGGRYAVLRSLQNAFLALLVTVCAKPMRWLSTAVIWLERIDHCALPDIFKLVASLFAVPCFEVSHFLFKFTYSINIRRMRLVGCHNALLHINESGLKIGNFGKDAAGRLRLLYALQDIKSCLDATQASNDFGNHHNNLPQTDLTDETSAQPTEL